MLKTCICIECGAEFTPSCSRQVCCSDKCKLARKFKQDKASRKRVRALRKKEEPQPRICPECGQKFTPNRGNRIYCSDECQRERANRQRRKSKRINRRYHRARKLSPRKQLQVNLARLDLLAPKPKIEIIERNGIVIERRGTVPLGCHAVGLIRHNA